MPRMSRKGWNNVLIFSMLILIVIFNWERFIGEQEPPTSQNALPRDAVVLKATINQLSFERIGTGWRVIGNHSSAEALDNSGINQLIEAWKSIQISSPNETINLTELFPPDYTAEFFMVGEEESTVISIKQFDQSNVIILGDKYYKLDSPQLDALIP